MICVLILRLSWNPYLQRLLFEFLFRFQNELKAASEQVATNNRLRDLHHKYLALDPSVMPNYPGV